MDSGTDLLRGRPYGGLGILWRKSIAHLIKLEVLDDNNRLLAIQLEINGRMFSLLNVYMPYDDGTNIYEFQEYLHQIGSFVADNPYSFALGDFNADTLHGSRFGHELQEYCTGENIYISDVNLSDHNSFTYISEAHDYKAFWLDHMLSTHTIHKNIKRVWVNYGCVSSDHFPMMIEMKMEGEIGELNDNEAQDKTTFSKVKWSELAQEQLCKYTQDSGINLSKVRLDHSLILCDNPGCKDTQHTAAIDALHEAITSALTDSSRSLREKPATSHPQHIAGWTEVCAELHEQARDAFLLWRANASPRHGHIFDLMRRSRARFKHALRQCRRDESMHAANSLAEKFIKTSQKEFWKQVDKMNNKNVKAPYSHTINGKSGNAEIAEMWKEHFQSLLNSSKLNVPDCTKELDTQDELSRITPAEIKDAIGKLKMEKSTGSDNIYAEHCKYADIKLHVLLAMFYNCMIVHDYLPHDFMTTIIVPIVKDKKGDLTSCDNYRPVALTTIMSKVFELVILERYRDILVTSDNQFGFKPKLGTEECVFVLKQVIDFYQSHSSPVYVSFLDLSKAFDRVNHNILFKKLLKIGIHPLIVRIFSTWYSTQSFCIRWASSLSSHFTVRNGTRQGSILSPLFFNIYTDNLSFTLKSIPVGCYINNRCLNHLMYADDMILIAPSPVALQELVQVCEAFIKENDLQLNKTKSKFMVFKNSIMHGLACPDIFMEEKSMDRVSFIKYLGVFLCDDCTDDMSILSCIRGIFLRGNLIKKNFSHCSKDVKIKLFQSYCSNFYCCSLWNVFKMESYKKLKISHNKVFRFMCNCARQESISQQFVKFNVPNSDVIRRKLIYSLQKRIFVSNNDLIATILNSTWFITSKLFVFWTSILNVM